jgi:hypothetical protein
MSTTQTLARHPAEDAPVAWRLYVESFETARVVYLELNGVSVEQLRTRERELLSEGSGVDVVLRLPIETAQQLGLSSIVPPESWESVCRDKDERIRRGIERLRGSVTRYDDPTEPAADE